MSYILGLLQDIGNFILYRYNMNVNRHTLTIIVTILALMCSGCYSYTRSNYSITIIQTTSRQTVVTGRVIDRKDNIPLAEVQVSSIDNLTSTNTDRDGYYKLKLNGGHHKIKASWIGYFHNYCKVLNLKEGDSVILNFKMKADDRPLEDVSID